MLVGKKLGPYLVDKELGSGAMGTVYRAKHTETGQKVAIKLMAPGLGSGNAQARFQREASILKQLDHPHIIKFLGAGKIHNQLFFIMEYVKGESLDQVMERRGRISWEEVVTLGQQLCSALQHAHDKGIIHRDLKPANVMVLPDGTLKLADFGIAKDADVTQLTAANSTVGTASYMSPEQCRGARDISNKSDLYSFGVMLYELATGKKPLVAETIMEMFQQHAEGKFERPSRVVLDMPIWLDTLICQLMEKKPENRPLNADLVSKALSQVKEKVEAQQSAGIDAAKKRRVDKTPQDQRLDEEDKEAARSLLGKKKKKKKAAFYQQGWFTLLALGVILVGAGTGAYFVFFKAPSPESLVSQAQRLMQSTDDADRAQARKGPLQQFLQLYPTHDQAPRMRRWADEIDLQVRDRQMHNRRAKFKAEGEAEPLARQALDAEDLGKLDEAKNLWQTLLPYQDKTDADQRPWGLVADKYVKELAAVDELYRNLQAKGGKEESPSSESKEESLALEAVLAEAQEKSGLAKVRWNDLKKMTESQAELRRWYLLAAWRGRQLETGTK